MPISDTATSQAAGINSDPSTVGGFAGDTSRRVIEDAPDRQRTPAPFGIGQLC